MRTVQGPGFFMPFAGDAAPFNRLPAIINRPPRQLPRQRLHRIFAEQSEI